MAAWDGAGSLGADSGPRSSTVPDATPSAGASAGAWLSVWTIGAAATGTSDGRSQASPGPKRGLKQHNAAVFVGRVEAGAGKSAPESLPVGLRPTTNDVHLIGTGRKGSYNRPLKVIDLALLVAGEDPGRELAAAWERKDQFAKAGKTIECGTEEEFIELALAGKAWMLQFVPDTRTSDLITHFDVLHKDSFTIPLAQRVAYQKKVCLELSIETQWHKWACVLKPNIE